MQSSDHLCEHLAEPEHIKTVQCEITDTVYDMKVYRDSFPILVHCPEERDALMMISASIAHPSTINETDLISSEEYTGEEEDEHEHQSIEEVKGRVLGR